MKRITLYESTDGSRWPTETEAEERDALDARVRAIEATLPEIPKSSGSRVKLDVGVLADAKTAVVMLCREEFPGEQVFTHDPMKIHPMSFAGRFLSDVGGPLERVWRWFACQSDGWLYQQPFYALNPDKFEEDKCLTHS